MRVALVFCSHFNDCRAKGRRSTPYVQCKRSNKFLMFFFGLENIQTGVEIHFNYSTFSCTMTERNVIHFEQSECINSSPCLRIRFSKGAKRKNIFLKIKIINIISGFIVAVKRFQSQWRSPLATATLPIEPKPLGTQSFTWRILFLIDLLRKTQQEKKIWNN